VVDHPRFTGGDYTYASAHQPPDNWAAHLAPYLYDFSSERLMIGKFCQIADGALFITASANHRYDGFSSFPFAVFGGVREFPMRVKCATLCWHTLRSALSDGGVVSTE